jgi:hypothetical protein
MDRQQAIVDGSGNVHRATVYADDKSRDANEPDQLEQ